MTKPFFILTFLFLFFLSACNEIASSGTNAPKGDAEGMEGRKTFSIKSSAFLYGQSDPAISTVINLGEPGVLCEGGICPESISVTVLRVSLEDIQSALASDSGETVVGQNVGHGSITPQGFLNGRISFNGDYSTPIVLVVDDGNSDFDSVFLSVDILNSDNPKVAIKIPADGNGNGTVDAADYVTWRDGGILRGDYNFDGVVDTNDYNIWRRNFGNTICVANSSGVYPKMCH